MRYLITGIPRSGTTLCCHVLNQQHNVVALHEPINPHGLDANTGNINQIVLSKYAAFKQAIYDGTEFEHGDIAGLSIDNPVGLDIVDGKRAVVAKRGNIKISEYVGREINLYVKQNAFFTVYLTQLTHDFTVTAIVRNPVDVLLSWWTINLPVTRGRLPAGEQNDASFQHQLSVRKDVLSRQLYIYEWFIRQYVATSVSIVKYEDIIESNGAALFQATHVKQSNDLSLQPQIRTYPSEQLQKLEKNYRSLIGLNCFGLYSSHDIANRIQALID